MELNTLKKIKSYAYKMRPMYDCFMNFITTVLYKEIFSIVSFSKSILCPEAQPIKFITTKCRMTCAKMKSAKARSGDSPLKSFLFLGFVWIRKQTEN